MSFKYSLVTINKMGAQKLSQWMQTLKPDCSSSQWLGILCGCWPWAQEQNFCYHSASISWSEHLSYFCIKGGGIILFPFFLLFVCLLCSIKAQTLWSKLCFPDFLWSPEQRGVWWHTAVRIIGIVSVINQTSGWAGFCPVPTFFMDKQGRTQWDKKKKKVRGLGLRVMPTLCLPNSKTKLLVKIRWSGKNYFFLAELGHAAEFLVRSTFLWAGCKDLKNGVYNGKADTM